ncbi:MAG: DUF1015 domain-containing protein [Clostridiales bacterium]|nr:DUF1015 domain-containing protein [Clostridiales bacterium]
MGTNWRGLSVKPADLLLPKAPYNNHFWPVVALDQYTSQKDIWQKAEREVGNHPSTLKLIVPEAFLDEAEERSGLVFGAMKNYLARDLFMTLKDSFVLVERDTQSGKRIGLVMTIDLEDYDYAPGSQSKIRATEQTVLERIPPRQLVREQSALEISHVMLLVDDPSDSLIGPLYAQRAALPLVYDIPLMMKGGRLMGWQVNQAETLAGFHKALSAFKNQLQPGQMLFAVGDGNHSLAAAKASWEKQKAGLSEEEQDNHIARFALVELVNLHSPALLFTPIHRLVIGMKPQEVLDALAPLMPVRTDDDPDITLISKDEALPLKLQAPGDGLIIDAVQRWLDKARLPLDYVHGEADLREIIQKSGGTGILMPDFPKDRLFPVVERDGRLPRKTFSMGEANEKRFYMEARSIR